MSSLPIAERCGAAGRLLQGLGAGRSALMSSAFHARAAGDQEAADKCWMMLTTAERDELSSWKLPDDVHVGHVTLRYAEADKELRVGLDRLGQHCEPCDRCITIGHLDFAWSIDGTAYVVDIKRSHWTTEDGPHSLQILAYGLAYASKQGCESLVTGIWSPTDGSYDWSDEAFDVSTWSSWREATVARVVFAAANDGEAVTGPHCSGCFASGHCPEHLLPGASLAAASDGALAPYTEPGGITPDNAPELLSRYLAAKELVAKAKGALERFASQNGGIEYGDKLWAKVQSKGGMRLDTKALENDYPELVQRYMVRTGPRSMGYRLVNNKG